MDTFLAFPQEVVDVSALFQFFGGFSPFIASWLVAKTGNPLAPAWYLIASSAIGIVAILMIAETKDVALAD